MYSVRARKGIQVLVIFKFVYFVKPLKLATPKEFNLNFLLLLQMELSRFQQAQNRGEYQLYLEAFVNAFQIGFLQISWVA